MGIFVSFKIGNQTFSENYCDLDSRVRLWMVRDQPFSEN